MVFNAKGTDRERERERQRERQRVKREEKIYDNAHDATTLP